MNIKSLLIETVFSGFIHLIWLALLCIIILGESPIKILNSLATIESGMAVLLTPLLFSLSFFLGRVAEHFLIAANYFCNKSKRQRFIDSFIGTKEEIWGNKIFFCNSALGIFILDVMMLILSESWNERLAILILGAILLIGTASSFVYWLKFGMRLRKE